MPINAFEGAKVMKAVVDGRQRQTIEPTDTVQSVIDKIGGAEINKWSEKQYNLLSPSELGSDYLNPDGTKKDFNDLTVPQKGLIMTSFVQGQMRIVSQTESVPGQVDTTRRTAKQAAVQDSDTDWGSPEAGEDPGGRAQPLAGGGGKPGG